jgi:hypothetical protein
MSPRPSGGEGRVRGAEMRQLFLAWCLPVKCLLRDGLLDPVNFSNKSLWTSCGRHAMIQMIESPS